jgi:hypothetical protein
LVRNYIKKEWLILVNPLLFFGGFLFPVSHFVIELGRYNGNKEELAYCKYDYLGKQTEAVDFAQRKTSAQYDSLG